MKAADSQSRLFKKTDLFESLPEADIHQVIASCREIFLQPGQCLFDEGDSGDAMYLVYKGEIAIHKDGQRLAIRSPGEYFGELGMIQSETRTASAKAVGEAHLLELNRETFYSQLANRPQTLNALLRTVTDRSRQDLDFLGKEHQQLQSQTQLNDWLKDLLDNTQDGIFVFEPGSLKIRNANACVQDNLNYEISELTQKTFLELLQDLTPEKFEKKIEPLNARQVDWVFFEDHLQRKNGTRYPVEIKVGTWNTGNEFYYVAIGKDKSEMAEMEKIRDQALKANLAKSEFLSMMSHELRTPLNAILGFGQLLEYSTNEPLTRQQIEWLAEILKAGNYMVELIGEILDLARIEAGKVALSIEQIDLPQLVEEVLPLIAHATAGRGIQIENRISGSLEGLVWADRKKLKQVMINLLSNAVKYNRDKGTIFLDCNKDETGSVQFSIEDTGMGIAGDKLQNLFQAFNRLDAENSTVEGTGLGLVITKQLVEKMGGCIDVVSTVGKGTRFTVTLPVEDVSNPVIPRPARRERKIPEQG